MIFSVWPVVPVGGCTNLLRFCPVLHAVSLTITKRHRRGEEGRQGRIQVAKSALDLVRDAWIWQSTRSQSGSMTSHVCLVRPIQFVLFVSAFPGFSLGLRPSEKPRKLDRTRENQIQLILFSFKFCCWMNGLLEYIKPDPYKSNILLRKGIKPHWTRSSRNQQTPIQRD